LEPIIELENAQIREIDMYQKILYSIPFLVIFLIVFFRNIYLSWFCINVFRKNPSIDFSRLWHVDVLAAIFIFILLNPFLGFYKLVLYLFENYIVFSSVYFILIIIFWFWIERGISKEYRRMIN
jgi:hypothetical protein